MKHDWKKIIEEQKGVFCLLKNVVNKTIFVFLPSINLKTSRR